jgi:hypothetical protein
VSPPLTAWGENVGSSPWHLARDQVSRNRLSSCFDAVATQRDVRIAPTFVDGLLLREAATLGLLGRDAIGMTEIHAAGECLHAVHHHDLAMVRAG